MILAWMGYAAAAAALCAVAGACTEFALRNRSRHRRLVWVVSMGASVVLPLAAPFVASRAPAPAVVVNERAEFSVQAARNESGEVAAPPRDWEPVVLTLWEAASALLAVVLIGSHLMLRYRLRGFREAVVDGQPALVSDDFGPAVVGLWQPRIVLPLWVMALDHAERRLVVSHECEHQRAHDPMLAIGALGLVVCMPWNLALWWQLARLRLAIELDCDARVVEHQGADPFAYGHMLVTAHERSSHTGTPALALAPLRSALGQRVSALVARTVQSRRRTAGAVSFALLALALLAMAPVPVMPRMPTSAPATMEIVSAARNASGIRSVPERSPASIASPTVTTRASQLAVAPSRARSSTQWRNSISPSSPGRSESVNVPRNTSDDLVAGESTLRAAPRTDSTAAGMFISGATSGRGRAVPSVMPSASLGAAPNAVQPRQESAPAMTSNSTPVLGGGGGGGGGAARMGRVGGAGGERFPTGGTIVVSGPAGNSDRVPARAPRGGFMGTELPPRSDSTRQPVLPPVVPPAFH